MASPRSTSSPTDASTGPAASEVRGEKPTQTTTSWTGNPMRSRSASTGGTGIQGGLCLGTTTWIGSGSEERHGVRHERGLECGARSTPSLLAVGARGQGRVGPGGSPPSFDSYDAAAPPVLNEKQSPAVRLVQECG